MKFVTNVTNSGIARAMASALVLAFVVSSTGLIMADWGPARRDVSVRIYNGEPSTNNGVSGATVKFVAHDNANPDNGVTVTTNASGEYELSLFQGTYTVQVSHPDFYPESTEIYVLGHLNADISLIPKVSEEADPENDGDTCFPVPPRGQPLLNIWPISDNGANCTDYPLLAGKNVTDNTDYQRNATISANENDVLRFRLYVHNGTIDFPENKANNVFVKASVPDNRGSATIAAEAWANNAVRIYSHEKGGNLTVSMGSGEYLEFISGSTKVYSRGPVEIGGGSNSVVTSGQSLGDMRGCYEFLRFVTFEARVKKDAPTPPPPGPTPPPAPVPPAPVPPPPGPTPPPPAPVATVNLEKTVRNVSDNQNNFVETANADPGEQVEFQLRVTAGHTVHNLKIADVLPSRLTYVANTLKIEGAAAGNDLSNVLVGTLTSATKTLTFRATVSQASEFAVGSTTLVNTANLTSSAGSDSDTANVVVNRSVTPSPVLRIDKTVRNVSTSSTFVEQVNAYHGELVEFRIVVTNTGNANVNDVRVTDNLPSLLKYETGSLTVNGALIASNIFSSPGVALGNLNPNQSVTLTFRAKAQSVTADQTVVNVATATSTNAGSVSDSAQVILKAVPVTPGMALSKSAYNVTQKKDATKVTAKAGDVIIYTLIAKNTGNVTSPNFVVEDGIADILELAEITDFGGANLNTSTKVLAWPAYSVPVNTYLERKFTVRVKNPIPTGTDYIMTNIYGNKVDVPVARPYVAPPTGTASTISLILAAISVTGYFFYRRSHAARVGTIA